MFFPWRKAAGAWIWQPFIPYILPRVENVWSFTSNYMSVLLWFITHKDRFIFLSVRFEVLWSVCSEDGVRMDAQILGTGFSGRLNLVWWHMLFVGPRYGIWVLSHIWRWNCEVVPRSFENVCTPGLVDFNIMQPYRWLPSFERISCPIIKV